MYVCVCTHTSSSTPLSLQSPQFCCCPSVYMILYVIRLLLLLVMIVVLSVLHKDDMYY
ncbi:hypothetical protein OAV88_01700 [bacterium]|nr:hypothetical protein [bacterium]